MKEENALYSCEYELDAYDYRKTVRYFPKMYWKYISIGTIINFTLFVIGVIAKATIIDILAFATLFQIFIMLFCKLKLEYITEKVSNIRIKKGTLDTNFDIQFYNEYFIIKAEKTELKLKYSEIDRCIESEDEFYLEYKNDNKVFIILKSSCSLELIDFIRENFDNYENHLGDRIKFKGVKKK